MEEQDDEPGHDHENAPTTAEPRTLLVHFLRDHLGLTGTHSRPWASR